MKLQQTHLIATIFAATIATSAAALSAERPAVDVDCEPTNERLVYACSFSVKGRKSGQAIEAADFKVSADMPRMPMAHNVKPIKPEPTATSGTYQGKLHLEMTGEWLLKMEFQKPVRDIVVKKMMFGDHKGQKDHGKMGHASDITVGKIKISKPWSRATPRGAPVGAGYLMVHNMGAEPDRLISGKSIIAERVEFHTMEMTGGVMKMRRLADGLEIPAGKMVELKPGSYHIMFSKLKKPIVKGEKFKATLVFEKSGEVDVEFTPAAIGAQMHHGAGASGKHGQMKMKHN